MGKRKGWGPWREGRGVVRWGGGRGVVRWGGGRGGARWRGGRGGGGGEGEGVMDDTVGGDTPKVLVRKAGKEELSVEGEGGDTPKVLVRKAGKEELSVEGELEKERQLPKEVLEKLQQQRREMAAVVGSTRVSNGPLVCPAPLTHLGVGELLAPLGDNHS